MVSTTSCSPLHAVVSLPSSLLTGVLVWMMQLNCYCSIRLHKDRILQSKEMSLQTHFLTHNTLKHSIKITACTCTCCSHCHLVKGFLLFSILLVFVTNANEVNILYFYWRIFLVCTKEKFFKNPTSRHTRDTNTEPIRLLEATCGVTLLGLKLQRAQLLSDSQTITQSQIRPSASVYIIYVNTNQRCVYWCIFNIV